MIRTISGICLVFLLISNLFGNSKETLEQYLNNYQYAQAKWFITQNGLERTYPLELIECHLGLDSLDLANELLEQFAGSSSDPYVHYLRSLSSFKTKKPLSGDVSLQRINDPYLKVKASLLLAKSVKNPNNNENGLTFLNQVESIVLAPETNSTVLAFDYYLVKGNQHYYLRNFDEAIAQYQRAEKITIINPLVSPLQQKKLFGNLAITFTMNWNYQEARKYHGKTIDIIRSGITDSSSIAISYSNLGIFYGKFDNLIASQNTYQTALSFVNNETPSVQKMELYNNYANLLKDLFDYSRAVEYYQKALSAVVDTNECSRFYPYLNLSGTLLSIYESSRSTLDQIFVQHQLYLDTTKYILNDCFEADHISHLYYLKLLGRSYMLNNQLELAFKVLDRAHSIAIKDHPNEMELLMGILSSKGLIQKRLGDLRTSLMNEREALNIINSLYETPSSEKCISLNNIGILYQKLELLDSALIFFDEAIQENQLEPGTDWSGSLLAQFISPYELLFSYYAKADTYFKKYKAGEANALEQAKSAIVQAQNITDIFLNELKVSSDRISYFSSTLEVFHLAFQIWYEVYIKDPKSVNFDQLLLISEKVKSQTLLSIFKQERINSFAKITQDLIKAEEVIRKERSILISQVANEIAYGEYANEDLLNEYKESLEEYNARYQQVSDSIQNNYVDFYNLKFNNTTATTDIIRNEIFYNNKTALVEYMLVADSVLFAQLITPKSTQVIKLDFSQEEKVTAIRNQTYHFKTQEYKLLSSDLYQDVFAPIDSILKKEKIKTVIIIPDDYLGYLPFELLIDGKGKFLIEKYEMSYSYSSTLLWQQTNEIKPELEPGSFIGISPSFGEPITEEPLLATRSATYLTRTKRKTHDELELQPLPYTKLEVNEIGQLISDQGYEVDIILGDNAHERTVKELDLSKYFAVHMASHSFVDYDNPNYSGIALTPHPNNAEDDILFGDEIYSFNLNADLVTLSACETGLGKVYKGEGIVGLTRGFLYAGARNLVVSQWKVEDQSTALFMTTFYKYLYQTGNLTQSLRKAKLKMIKSKTFDHPYYWAPFVLIGYY